MSRKRKQPGVRPRGDYELKVLDRGRRPLGLELVEGTNTNGATPEGMRRVARIWGDPLDGVMEQVFRALRNSGHRPSDLGPSRKRPFSLDEEDGVRLGLLFVALKPLRKSSRIEAVAGRIRQMETEEMYYWFSKVTSEAEGRR